MAFVTAKGPSPFNRTKALKAWAGEREEDVLDKPGAPGFARSAQERAMESAIREGKTIYRFKPKQRVVITIPKDEVKAGSRGVVDRFDGTSRAGAPLYVVGFDVNGMTRYVQVVEAALNKA
jgi:hypothetical protein